MEKVRHKPQERGKPGTIQAVQRKPVWARLDVDLHRRLKAQAALEGRDLREVMEDAMRDYLAGRGK